MSRILHVKLDYLLVLSGKELKRFRQMSGLTIRDVAEEMKSNGWGYYPMKISRLERTPMVCMASEELKALAAIYNVEIQAKEEL
jgi:transcriptional regulator with XRE-family HTH domain